MGLKTVIIEDFEQQTQWQPGETVTKTVSICNVGISPGFARVSFEEIMRTMNVSSVPEPYANPGEAGVEPEFCMIGEWSGIEWEIAGVVFNAVEYRENGVLITPDPAGVVVKVLESPAGVQRNRYAIYQALDALGPYRRMTAQFSVSGTTLIVNNPRYWGYKNAYDTELEAAWGLANETNATLTPPSAANIGGLVTDAGEKISIDYTNVINDPIAPIGGGTLTDPATDEGKWFYEGGFFYYIGRIEPGISSARLMTGLMLAYDADISYSSINLQFIVNLQSLQLNAQALVDDWGLSTSGQLYAHLSSFC
jgi:hypothetical protein